MLNRLYFSRSSTFILKRGRDLLFLRGNCKLYAQEAHKLHGKYTWRKLNALQQNTSLLAGSKITPTALAARFYQGRTSTTNKSWKAKIWTIVRGVLLASGGLVWFVALIAYFSLDQVTVDVMEDDAASNAFQRKLAEHFYKEKNEADIVKKENALDGVWQKLSKEEEIRDIFGHPVFICGYNYKFMNEAMDAVKHEKELDGENVERQVEQENKKEEENVEMVDDLVWEAGCYIEGPKKMGVMTVKFEKHREEWVPVSLELETLERTGHVVSNVSAPLPNGIKNFTRLSN